MEYPTLYVKQKNRQMTDAFLGYNHNLRIGDNEFYDMKNMTSDYFPVLSPRNSRGVWDGTNFNTNGFIAKEGLCYVDGPCFIIGDEPVDMSLIDGPKDLISMGAYVIVMPDRKWINTIKKTDEDGQKYYEHGDIDALVQTIGDVVFTMCDQDGNDYETDNIIFNDQIPTNDDGSQVTQNGFLWCDTSSKPHTLKKYSAASGSWVVVSKTYVKIFSEGSSFNEKFKEYDGVKISGIVVENIAEGTMTDLNGMQSILKCENDYIVVDGWCEVVSNQDKPITITRQMPDVDFLIESNNRLWGCHYGVNENGEMINEIYASKLGDFKNWNCFLGVSTDSYRASCGTDGPFTGAITHMGYPLFFKENCIHKVYGNYPANFQIQATSCRGVQNGSGKSLAIVGETLFYKSSNGVCAYDGSLPIEISSALGDVRYYNAVACAHNNKYYINMQNKGWHLFVYDAEKGMWHKEDNIQVDAFCSYMDELYAIDHETKMIITMLSSGTNDGDNVQWMVETGLLGMSMPDMKYISKLLIRMSLDVGASVKVSIQYDSIGDWEKLCDISTTTLRSLSIPILPRRCDHFRLHIEGYGNGRIYSITKTIEQGSDVS